MDIKTYEYMRVRIEKSKLLMNKIEELKRNIKLNNEEVHSILFRYNGSSFEIERRIHPKLFGTLKDNFTVLATAEIKRLEQELAEL
jgi:hypothetical protein